MDFFKGETKVILAPMAGVCDRAFRELCKEFGASYTVSEMVSAKALTMNDKKTYELLTLSKSERPSAIQLFGDDAATMAAAAKIAAKFSPDSIDINMGCPAPKIASNGAGAALMKNPKLASDIVLAVSTAADVPVTVKIRTGYDKSNINAPLFAKMLESCGAAAICVHGRTKEQMYAPPIDFETIAAVKQSVKIPVVGNGNITDGKSAKEMLDKTLCDALMVGRGSLGRPWVFKIIKEYLDSGKIMPEPTMEERMKVLCKHIETLCKYKGEYVGMREARKHAAWYIKGVRDAAKYRNLIGSLKSIDELYRLCKEIAVCEPSDTQNCEFNNFCFNNYMSGGISESD